MKPLSRELTDAGTDIFVTIRAARGHCCWEGGHKLKGQTYHLFRGEPYMVDILQIRYQLPPRAS